MARCGRRASVDVVVIAVASGRIEKRTLAGPCRSGPRDAPAVDDADARASDARATRDEEDARTSGIRGACPRRRPSACVPRRPWTRGGARRATTTTTTTARNAASSRRGRRGTRIRARTPFRAAATPRQSESVDATVDIVGAVRARAGASETECEAARRREARRRCVEWSALTMTLFSAITRRANNATQRNAEILRSALLRTAPRAPTATMAPT